MRVALTFPGCHRRGGVERVMVECANYLAAQGHETHVYASEWDPDVLDRRAVRHAVPLRRRPSAIQPWRFRSQCGARMGADRARYDVLSTFGVESPAGGVIWVQSVHQRWLEISSRERDWKGRLRQKANLFHPVVLSLERQCFGQRRYRKCIALTEEVKADLIRCYGVPADDVVVLPNGFLPAEFNTRRTEELRPQVRQELGYGAGERVVVFVANELERKGFGPLLRAAARLHDPSLRLLVVGRVSPDAYQSEIDSLGMSGSVRFVGASSDVARFYAAADLFALPTYYEAWGLVIVEAMACGLPVLTSKLAGAAVAVEPGRSGELVDNPRDAEEVADRLGQLLRGAYASRDEISASVQRYAWQEVLTRYEQLLRECAV